MKNCAVCDGKLNVFLDFGKQPIANGFRDPGELTEEYFFQMQVAFCPSCKMVQLLDQPEKERMFHENYAFHSSTSDHMQSHFRQLAQSLIQNKQLSAETSLVVEIGCNDGILLRNFSDCGIPHLGIEPSGNVAEVAKSRGIDVLTQFFTQELAEKLVEERGLADVILSANVMCHIPYLHSVFAGVKILLKKDGLFIFEDPYVLDIIEKQSFDQIYDEHTFLFSVLSVSNLAKQHDLVVIDVQRQKTHGGSMRYILTHSSDATETESVQMALKEERLIGVDRLNVYRKFATRINDLGRSLIDLLQSLREKGERVVGYGATSKSTTVLNYFGIDSTLVACIYDTTPTKVGKVSPGVGIPIRPYDSFHDETASYILLFAWNHKDEILKKENDFMASNNKKWIVYVPEVEILTA